MNPNQALLEAAYDGDVALVQELYPRARWSRQWPADHLLSAAILGQQPAVLHWLITNAADTDVFLELDTALEQLVQVGNVDLLGIFQDAFNVEPPANVLMEAAEQGSVLLLANLLRDYTPDPAVYLRMLDKAAEHGHLDLVRWLVGWNYPLPLQTRFPLHLVLREPGEVLRLVATHLEPAPGRAWFAPTDVIADLGVDHGGYAWPELLIGLINMMTAGPGHHIFPVDTLTVMFQLNTDRGFWAARHLSPSVDLALLPGFRPRPLVLPAIGAGLRAALPADLARYVERAL